MPAARRPYYPHVAPRERRNAMAAHAPLADRQRRPKSTHAEVAAATVAKHRLDVFATSVAEIVSLAGAWLTDRALEGWNVTVVLPAGDNLRPLQILGVTTLPLEGALPVTGSSPGVTEVAVSTVLLNHDKRVYARVLAELANGASDITLVGDDKVADEFNTGFHLATHVSSGAGRAFKAQAVRAVGFDPESHCTSEAFRTNSARWTTTKPTHSGTTTAPATVHAMRAVTRRCIAMP